MFWGINLQWFLTFQNEKNVDQWYSIEMSQQKFFLIFLLCVERLLSGYVYKAAQEIDIFSAFCYTMCKYIAEKGGWRWCWYFFIYNNFFHREERRRKGTAWEEERKKLQNGVKIIFVLTNSCYMNLLHPRINDAFALACHCSFQIIIRINFIV